MQVFMTAESIRDRFLGVRAKLDQISVEDREFGVTLEQGFGVVRHALDTFDPSSLAVSFNGGKDACVVLYLLLLVLAERDRVDLLCAPRGKVGGNQ